MLAYMHIRKKGSFRHPFGCSDYKSLWHGGCNHQTTKGRIDTPTYLSPAVNQRRSDPPDRGILGLLRFRVGSLILLCEAEALRRKFSHGKPVLEAARQISCF